MNAVESIWGRQRLSDWVGATIIRIFILVGAYQYAGEVWWWLTAPHPCTIESAPGLGGTFAGAITCGITQGIEIAITGVLLTLAAAALFLAVALVQNSRSAYRLWTERQSDTTRVSGV